MTANTAVPVDLPAFEASLRADGYSEVLTREMAAGTHVDTHHHPFDVRALMLSGELALSCEGQTCTYRVGDVFTMAAGVLHAEKFGATPASYLVGRRRV